MKSYIWRFVRNQSGAVSFEDGLTVVSLTVGIVAALSFMNGSIAQLYASIFGVLTGFR